MMDLEVENRNVTQEFRDVKALAEKIGYHELMFIASALHKNKLEDEGGFVSEAALPVTGRELVEMDFIDVLIKVRKFQEYARSINL